jgi:hypothetical protein
MRASNPKHSWYCPGESWLSGDLDKPNYSVSNVRSLTPDLDSDTENRRQETKLRE